MSKIKVNDLFDIETLDFLIENLSMRTSIKSQTNDGTYMLQSKEGIASTNEDEIKNEGKIDKTWLIRELYTAREEAKNAFNAVEKIIYIKNALNVGKHIDPDNLIAVTVDNTSIISICTI